MKRIFFVLSILLLSGMIFSQEIRYKTMTDIHYYDNDFQPENGYLHERCLLDIYYPENKSDFATVVWFHGGGLTGGAKEIPSALKEKGFCVVGVNYRLAPQAKAPAYIEDAAAAVAWVFEHIKQYGGNPSKIIVSGHSAGGYLTCMIGLDKRWLAAHHIDADRIAALVPFSAQTITHFTIRKERGIPDIQPVVDEYAPLFHVRPDAPPLLLITGDRELELLGRYEENAYLARMMKIAGHTQTRLLELQGYGHDMAYPAFPLLIREIEEKTR
ncbi:MAG TPA: lipase [Porphyromonadaceae bacterium]|nr:lipase [Porphyromonadaceae bacterium]HBL32276.1 lipase [Porphyromonadaceae bacterium]HCM20347.1 lipase [Porphyromonadaceae bacterium]